MINFTRVRLHAYIMLACLVLWIAPVGTAAAATASLASPTIEKIHMITANVGWLLTQTDLWRTTDGGLLWRKTLQWPDGTYLPAAQFLGASEAIIATNAGSIANRRSLHLYVSQDGGATWSTASLGHPASATLSVVDAIDIVDARDIWVLTGQDTRRGSNEPLALYHTMNGGHTWSKVIQVTYADHTVGGIPLQGMKTDVLFRNASLGWLVGVDKGDKVWLYRTQDGGDTWQDARIGTLPAAFRDNADGAVFPEVPVFASATSGILPVFFGNEGSGLCIYATTDGGARWTPGAPVKGGAGLALDPLNGQVIYAQSGRTFEVSQNQGATWRTISHLAPPAPAFLTFVSAQVGFLVDWNNHLWRTRDGGARWTPVPMTFSQTW